MRVLRSSATVVAVFALAAGASAAYTVRPGDTLTGIASRHGVTVSELARTNGISNPNLVQIGRSLEIPARPGAGGYPLALRRAPDRLSLVPHFRWWAAANNIPADLLMAMTWLESGWQNSIVSPKGAVGIGQLMPTTTEFIRSELIGVPTLDPRVPEQNIRLSARYLRWLLARANGDVRRALATYYQGPRSVETIGMYRDTVLYVDGVLALRRYFA